MFFHLELFQMQYSFLNNEAVDAIVRVGEFIIPIDTKLLFRQLQQND